MDPYDLKSNAKVVQNLILNKIKLTYFQFGRGIEMGVAADLNDHSSLPECLI